MAEILENIVPQKSDYGTPPEIAECTRALLGGIDLDPCSSPLFNEHVKATYIYTTEQNGIDMPWFARVYLNPPGGKARPRAKAWWQKLVEEYKAGNVHSAVYMSFALDSFQWSQGKGTTPILSFPTVVFAKRIKFYVEENGGTTQTKAPTRPCALTWLPPAGLTDLGAFKVFRDVLAVAGHECFAVGAL